MGIIIFLGTDERFCSVPGKARNGKELLPTLHKPARKVSLSLPEQIDYLPEVKELLTLEIVADVGVSIFKQLMARLMTTEGAGVRERKCCYRSLLALAAVSTITVIIIIIII